MPPTRSFKDTVKARADRDAAFREALLTESADALLVGHIDRAVLRDYINAKPHKSRKPARPPGA
jgi:hypothetical protein